MCVGPVGFVQILVKRGQPCFLGGGPERHNQETSRGPSEPSRVVKRMRGNRPDPQLPPSHVKKVALKKKTAGLSNRARWCKACASGRCFVVPSSCCFVAPAWSLRGGGVVGGGGGVITTDGAPVFVCTEM